MDVSVAINHLKISQIFAASDGNAVAIHLSDIINTEEVMHDVTDEIQPSSQSTDHGGGVQLTRWLTADEKKDLQRKKGASHLHQFYTTLQIDWDISSLVELFHEMPSILVVVSKPNDFLQALSCQSHVHRTWGTVGDAVLQFLQEAYERISEVAKIQKWSYESVVAREVSIQKNDLTVAGQLRLKTGGQTTLHISGRTYDLVTKAVNCLTWILIALLPLPITHSGKLTYVYLMVDSPTKAQIYSYEEREPAGQSIPILTRRMTTFCYT
ncbi:hypothetical protein BDZ91DRAFT_817954, partial [Kalaharituber pfeilii]